MQQSHDFLGGYCLDVIIIGYTVSDDHVMKVNLFALFCDKSVTVA